MTESGYRRIVISILVVVGVALYAHTLSYPFVFDGIVYIKANPLIKGFTYYDDLINILQFTQLDEKLGLLPDLTTNFALRPVTYITFTLNYLFGGMHPEGYRAVNIAIHIVNTIVLFFILDKLLRLPDVNLTLGNGSLRLIPVVTALLYLTHPLQTESVVYITQRFTSLATSFYLLTILLYLGSITCAVKRRAQFLKLTSVAVLLVGMLTKEIVFTAPILLLALELVIRKTSFTCASKKLFFHLLCLPVIPIMVIAVESAQSKSRASVVDALHIVSSGTLSWLQYAITQLSVITTYLRMLLLPYGQNVDPDYPVYHSLLQGRILFSMAIILLIIMLSVLIFKQCRNSAQASLLLFGVLWFFLTILPSSSIVPLPDLMAEHRTYLPSIGAFMATASGLDLLRTRLKSKLVTGSIYIIITAWVSLLASLTYVRSEVWQSNITLWKDSVAKSPNKARPLNNLGAAYINENNFPLSIICLNKALSVDPNTPLAYLNLADSYYKQEMFDKVITTAITALSRGITDASLYYYMGVAYSKSGLTDDAELALKEALAIKPNNYVFRKALIRHYLLNENVVEAEEQYCIIEKYLSASDELHTVFQKESNLNSPAKNSI